MDLQINSKSRVPVHLQLEQQIKHLIMTGGFEVGDRLPSIRAMAGFLRINRNTVARVFSDLEREGFVESRRGSGMYVLEPPVDAVEMKGDVLDRVMDLAAAQGLPVEDLAYALLARAGAEPREKTKILFVECTREELDRFSEELEAQLPVDVERVLLEDLPARLSEDGEPPWSLAVTTFFHVHEVQEMMEPLGRRDRGAARRGEPREPAPSHRASGRDHRRRRRVGPDVHGEPLALARGRRPRPPRLRRSPTSTGTRRRRSPTCGGAGPSCAPASRPTG